MPYFFIKGIYLFIILNDPQRYRGISLEDVYQRRYFRGHNLEAIIFEDLTIILNDIEDVIWRTQSTCNQFEKISYLSCYVLDRRKFYKNQSDFINNGRQYLCCAMVAVCHLRLARSMLSLQLATKVMDS